MTGAGVREGCKNVGRRGGFEEGSKRCFFSRGKRKDRFPAESVEGLQNSCHRNVTLQGSFRVAVAGVVCLGSTFSWQAQYF